MTRIVFVTKQRRETKILFGWWLLELLLVMGAHASCLPACPLAESSVV